MLWSFAAPWSQTMGGSPPPLRHTWKHMLRNPGGRRLGSPAELTQMAMVRLAAAAQEAAVVAAAQEELQMAAAHEAAMVDAAQEEWQRWGYSEAAGQAGGDAEAAAVVGDDDGEAAEDDAEKELEMESGETEKKKKEEDEKEEKGTKDLAHWRGGGGGESFWAEALRAEAAAEETFWADALRADEEAQEVERKAEADDAAVEAAAATPAAVEAAAEAADLADVREVEATRRQWRMSRAFLPPARPRNQAAANPGMGDTTASPPAAADSDAERWAIVMLIDREAKAERRRLRALGASTHHLSRDSDSSESETVTDLESSLSSPDGSDGEDAQRRKRHRNA